LIAAERDAGIHSCEWGKEDSSPDHHTLILGRSVGGFILDNILTAVIQPMI